MAQANGSATWPAELRLKLSKCVRLFGSDQAGEREGAVDAVGRVLAGAGRDFDALATILLELPDPFLAAIDHVLVPMLGEVKAGAWTLSTIELGGLREIERVILEDRCAIEARHMVALARMRAEVNRRTGRRS